MRKNVFIFFMCVIFQAHADYTKIYTNKTKLDVDDFVILTIESDKKISGNIDFTSLEKNFTVVGHGFVTKMLSENGVTQKIFQRQFRLHPLKKGKFIIPPVQVGQHTSKPITIEVTESQINNDEQQSVFIQVTSTSESYYIDTPIYYTMKVFYRHDVPLVSIQAEEPKSSDYSLQDIDEERHYRKNIDGVDFQVIEKTYLLNPKKAGKLIIPPTKIAGWIRVQRKRQDFFFDPMTSTKQIIRSSNPLQLEVKAKPKYVSDDAWFPMQQFTVKESWKHPEDVKVGEPIMRKVAMQGEGLVAEKLPDVSGKSTNDYRVYVDKPMSQNMSSSNSVQSKKVYSINYIPKKDGQITLPAMNFKWFNVKKHKVDVISLPEKIVQVKPQLVQPDRLTEHLELQTHIPWKHMAIILAVLWAVTLFAFVKYVVDSKKGIISQKDWLKAIHEAAKSHDIPKLANALLNWGDGYFPDATVQTLPQLAEILKPHPVSVLIVQLDKALYDNSTRAYPTMALWQALSDFLTSKKSAKTAKVTLPPLNPE